MNRRIRGSAGYADPAALAAAAIAAAEAAGDEKTMRDRIADRAGLVPGMGARLQGTNAAELAADAETIAAAVAEMRPAAPPSMSARLRSAAGRADAEDTAAEPPSATDFDGGARQSVEPASAASMNAQIRGARDERQERIQDHADFYE
jgi:hypothetical protein